MSEGNEFNFLHISDLHFSEGTDVSNKGHSHSVDHLIGLQKAVHETGDYDFSILSGDISNHGDRQSLINASGYIFDTIPIGRGESTGLKIPHERTGVIPGNHDAWNNTINGPIVDRRQKSLENYNFAFDKHQIPGNLGCYYKWIEKNGHGIYMAFVDSCYLGDTEKHDDCTFGPMRIDQAVAKGKLTVEQTETLIEWYDLGVRGQLLYPNNADTFIDGEKFAKSLKVIVMHHYLFEPPEHKSDYFMRVSYRDIVFRNIALADFDMLLCGHKHIPAFDIHSYGHHFDERAKNRYLINIFRRLIGLHSLPIQFEDEDGKRWSKALSMVSNIIYKIFKANEKGKDPVSITADVLEMLKSGLQEPEKLERKVKDFIYRNGRNAEEVLDKKEINEIKKRISVGLTVEERKELNNVAKKIVDTTKELKSKSFIQSMSGSTVKSDSDKACLRTFNKYRFSKMENGWKIKSFRYQWDQSTKGFDVDNPLVMEHSIMKGIIG